MKKIILFSILFATTFLIQAQNRLTLIEHFTQASCVYCPAGNEYINELIANHPDQVIVLRYQVSWPGYDPMYEHNPLEVDNRVSYYGVTGVPNTVYEGNLVGYYGYLTDAMIDDGSESTTPFEIELSHEISSDLDSIYVVMKITALSNSATDYKAHIAVVERHISFDSPPGSNGEIDFFNVMKKMLPNEQGTNLATSHSVNDEETIELAWELSNVYNINELAVVAFIQDPGNKQVVSTGFSDKKPAPADYDYDLGVTEISDLPPFVCGERTTIEPVISFQNFGAVSLTSIDFNYKVNDGTESTYSWTGAIAHTVKKEVALPETTFDIQQENFIYVWGSNLNGEMDENTSNDTLVYLLPSSNVTNKKVILELLTDDNPHQIFWKFIHVDDPSNPIERNSPYNASHANMLIKDTIELLAEGCHEFIIQDLNGLEDEAYYKLYDDNGGLIWEGGKFVGKETISFEGTMIDVGIASELQKSQINIYPNPSSKQTTLTIDSPTNTDYVVQIYSLLGQNVVQMYGELSMGSNTININCGPFENGIYFVKLSMNGEEHLQKLIIKK